MDETESNIMAPLYKALVAAQAIMSNASKDKKNPAFNSKYADLASVRDAVLPPLTANGICVIQQPETDADGALFVRTILAHESGATLVHEGPHVKISNTKNDSQAIMSATTYMRRCNLMAVCGIAPEDDDGNAAGNSEAPAMRPVGNGAPPPNPTRQPSNSGVSAKPRSVERKPDDFAPAANRGQNDDPLFIPVPRNQYGHDWTTWGKMMKAAGQDALSADDPVTAVRELFAANAAATDNFLAGPGVEEPTRAIAFEDWRTGLIEEADAKMGRA